jgi:hypothetical protein
VPTEDDIAFERELMSKNPGRKITRYDLPGDVEEAAAVYMFKMKNKDDLLAAEMADANMTAAERKSQQLTADAQRREAIRLSIVGIVNRDGTRRLIDGTRPLMELDDWDSSSWAALRTYFGDLNGLPMEELGNALRDARRVQPSVPATQPQAATATR